MMQRMAGSLVMNTPTPVTPFRPPPGNFPIASIQLELDLVGKAAADGKEVVVDAPEMVKHVQRVFHNHVFKIGQQFATEFGEKRLNFKVKVLGFDYVDMGAAAGERA